MTAVFARYFCYVWRVDERFTTGTITNEPLYGNQTVLYGFSVFWEGHSFFSHDGCHLVVLFMFIL